MEGLGVIGGASDEVTRRGGCRIARIRCARWLDEKDVRLFFGDGAMQHALGNNEDFARTERDIAFVHADRDATFEDEKEVVRVVVLVPDELALDLNNHEIVTVELANNSWLPMFGKGGEFLGEVDCCHRCLRERWVPIDLATIAGAAARLRTDDKAVTGFGMTPNV